MYLLNVNLDIWDFRTSAVFFNITSFLNLFEIINFQIKTSFILFKDIKSIPQIMELVIFTQILFCKAITSLLNCLFSFSKLQSSLSSRVSMKKHQIFKISNYSIHTTQLSIYVSYNGLKTIVINSLTFDSTKFRQGHLDFCWQFKLCHFDSQTLHLK